tara:strand:- start:77 stop:283 length:207 start_codon:yes stop_codon:yes gene_type:complete
MAFHIKQLASIEELYLAKYNTDNTYQIPPIPKPALASNNYTIVSFDSEADATTFINNSPLENVEVVEG